MKAYLSTFSDAAEAKGKPLQPQQCCVVINPIRRHQYLRPAPSPSGKASVSGSSASSTALLLPTQKPGIFQDPGLFLFYYIYFI